MTTEGGGEVYDTDTDATFDDFLRTDPDAQAAMKQQWNKQMENAMKTEASGEVELPERIALSSACDYYAHSKCAYPDRCKCDCHRKDTEWGNFAAWFDKTTGLPLWDTESCRFYVQRAVEYAFKYARSSQPAQPVGLPRPKIVCLCGSTRFANEFMAAQFAETVAGNIVLTVGCFPRKTDGTWDRMQVTDEQKVALDQLHFRKIELADEIFVINVGGYVGESTTNEINHARRLDKPIRWLEQSPSLCRCGVAWCPACQGTLDEYKAKLEVAAQPLPTTEARALYSRLVHLASALVTATNFISPCEEDHSGRTPRLLIRQAQAQREQLRLWAIEAREIAERIAAALSSTPSEQETENE